MQPCMHFRLVPRCCQNIFLIFLCFACFCSGDINGLCMQRGFLCSFLIFVCVFLIFKREGKTNFILDDGVLDMLKLRAGERALFCI
ncbi:hypothetical protein EDC01DRAFT_294341 [Geopyxis carbonaria]|nr:hypothetical protein EDC01DRAFT_294341 [Geopyxis carbonaria]